MVRIVHFPWKYVSGSTKVMADVRTNKRNIERCVCELLERFR